MSVNFNIETGKRRGAISGMSETNMKVCDFLSFYIVLQMYIISSSPRYRCRDRFGREARSGINLDANLTILHVVDHTSIFSGCNT